MHSEGIERVVIPEPCLDLDDHEIAEGAGNQADHDGRQRLHKTGCRGDRHQTGDRTGYRAQRARLAVPDPLGERPAQRGGSRSKVRVNEGAGGQRR